MADGDAGRCEPYRVEWRRHESVPWLPIEGFETLGEAERRAQRCMRIGGDEVGRTYGQARVVEQRVVLVRGLGQDGGPDQAFMDYTRGMAALADSVAERNHRIHGTDRDALAHIANVREWLTDDPAERVAYLQDVARDAVQRSVVSDPDDRRDVEAAADAGEPMAVGLGLNPDGSTLVENLRGCAHRMGSGAVSLTACGECGAAPGDDCAPPVVVPASCVQRMAQSTATGTWGERPRLVYPCGECGADPGDDCADSLEDRIAWAERDGGEHVAANLRRARALATPRFMHRTLDGLGVPRHAEPEQQTDTDETGDLSDYLIADVVRRLTDGDTVSWQTELGGSYLQRIADALGDARLIVLEHTATATRLRARPTPPPPITFEQALREGWGETPEVPDDDEDDAEAERVLDAMAAKMGGTSPLEAMMRETSAEVDALLAEHGKSHGSDPWWRRLARAARQHFA